MPPRPSSRSRSSAAPRRAAPPSADGYKTLRAAIDTRTFAPVYYLHGDDDFLKDASLQALLDTAIDGATRDFNCETRDGAALDAETLGSLLATPPMLAHRRAVVVRDVHLLKKAARAELDRYLKSPASDTLAILITPAGQATDASLASSSLACVFDPLTPERVRKWIAHHASTVLGVTVTTEATILLQQSVGDNLQQLASELDKCSSYARGAQRDSIDRTVPGIAHPVTTDGDASTGTGAAVLDEPVVIVDDAAVSAVVGVRRGETVTDLIDAILLRDVARSVSLVPFVLTQPKVSAVSIVMMLGTQMLAMAWGRAKRDAGWSSSQLAREYMSYMRETGGFVGRPWGEAGSLWTRAVEKWQPDELRRALRLLFDADVALKDTRVSNEEQIMMTLVMAMVPAARGRAA